MSNIDHDHLEELLRHASPRPTPSPADEAAVRDAVQREWRAVTGMRHKRRQVAQFALAASVLIVAFTAFNAFRTPEVAPVRVGTIARSVGPVYLLGEGSEPLGTADVANVMSGQTIVTGVEAGLAIAWTGGGSLRVDAGTRLSLVGPERVKIDNGRVYFDSAYQAAESASLVMETAHGEIRHVGTQYMVQVDQSSLIVSVREGQAAIDGRHHRQVAKTGQQVRLSGSAQPVVLSIARTGGDWRWIDRTSPTADVQGKSVHEFVVWACREIGLDYVFEGVAEERARNHELRGRIELQPSEALLLRLETAGLKGDIREGVIHISDESR